MSHTEVFLEGQVAFESPDFTIRHDRVQLEDGRQSRREVVCRPNRVMLLLLQGDAILLQKIERPALGGQCLEAPCVPIAQGQGPKQTVLQMSLGIEPRFLGQVRPSAAILQERVYVFAASMEQPAQGWQAVPLACWEDWVARGQIKDMRLVAALSLLATQENWEQEAEE